VNESRQELRDIVREVIREELASLAPSHIPVYRTMARRREDMGLTQEQVGKDLGFSTSAVGGWETGRMPMSSADLYAEYLGLRLLVVEIEPGKGPPLVTDDIRQRLARVRRQTR
jgi:transcriptional regulator with XRE-family HTH domain